jgi:HPt (histidine-containing phosphotransfer) domain-containing protein
MDAKDEGSAEASRFSLKEFHKITENDIELEVDIIETYVKSTREELNKLKTAIQQSETKAAEIIAHSIKGASRFLAATQMSRLALELEELCRDGNLTEATKCLSKLEEEMNETINVLCQYRDTVKHKLSL